MRYIGYWLSIFLSVIICTSGMAKENVGSQKKGLNKKLNNRLAAGCEPASAQVDLDINNVRARVMNGGDMWWDLVGSARYEIPKVTEEQAPRKHSLFAGALWIGGFDQGGNLRAAAMTYRQGQSYDFYPGPLDTATATITQNECEAWDEIWKISREEIDDFLEQGPVAMTDAIENWPTTGDLSKGQSQSLAPYVDINQDGVYNPFDGDYPDILGDQALWFVYNDKGNIHTETDAPAIGLEVQTMAFAFATNDEINNMTFYEQKIINRSKDRLDSVFFGQWVDADLGYAYDDYVGCDTTRDLGICYNGDDFDETVNGYGSNPPSVGVDFFQGPKDAEGNEIGMEYFVYYDNDFSDYGNPEQAQHYYNYLTGTWKNGDCITNDGENGRTGSNCTHYMFPGDPSDPDDWSEVTAGNKPFDRRFLQSAGPFTLMPGAVNYVTVGVVWAKATTGGNTGSLDLLKIADDKAQQLYNNNFDIVDGPDAPDLQVQELDRQIVLAFLNTLVIEKYRDTVISTTGAAIKYDFQGYRVFQIKDPTVSVSQLDNPDLARPIIQVDVEDKVDVLVNNIFDPDVSRLNAELMVSGSNEGIDHTFLVNTDAFASGDDRLVNYRPYYFTVVSYASADPTDSVSQNADIQYLEGRNNVQVYTAIPHSPKAENNGTAIRASYGDRPKVTRLEGLGNGGLILDLTEETEDEILRQSKIPNPVYDFNGGPVNVFVYDPLNVPEAEFELQFVDSNIKVVENYIELGNNARWILTNKTTGDQHFSDTTIGANYEQVFPEYGLSVQIDQTFEPDYDTITGNNGFIEASLTYEDDQVTWLTGVQDEEIPSGFLNASTPIPYPQDWIRAGKTGSDTLVANDKLTDDAVIATAEGRNVWIDPNEAYENILDGLIAPYGVVARAGDNGNGSYTLGPAVSGAPYNEGNVYGLHSVDLVFTNDKSKWTKSVVVEMSSERNLAEGRVVKNYLRDHPSVDKNGNEIAGDRGRSWFPGYAINLETAERLNIMFGEDSWLRNANGDDMLWNPTSEATNPAAGASDYNRYIWGGKHYIYVMGGYGLRDKTRIEGRIYEGDNNGGAYYQQKLTGSLIDIRDVYASAMWVMMPYVQDGFELLPLDEGLIPTETKIRLRVERPYMTYQAGEEQNNRLPLYGFETRSIAPDISEAMGETALDMVRAVPNPYYAYSKYEASQLDNRVRITNLPQRATISIYTMSGQLVRQFEKDETGANHITYLDWDLKNKARVPIGSGLYIIHIDGYELGETTLKFFAVMRPIDLDTF